MVLSEGGTVNTRFWLWGLVTMIPAVLNLLSLIPYIFYDLEGEKLETIHKEMRERRLVMLNAGANTAEEE